MVCGCSRAARGYTQQQKNGKCGEQNPISSRTCGLCTFCFRSVAPTCTLSLHCSFCLLHFILVGLQSSCTLRTLNVLLILIFLLLSFVIPRLASCIRQGFPHFSNLCSDWTKVFDTKELLNLFPFSIGKNEIC